MQRHRQKSSANAEMGIGMLTVNLVSVFKSLPTGRQAPQCRRNNYLYAVTSICSPHHTLWVMGSIPIPDFVGIAQLARATESSAGSNPAPGLRSG